MSVDDDDGGSWDVIDGDNGFHAYYSVFSVGE